MKLAARPSGNPVSLLHPFRQIAIPGQITRTKREINHTVEHMVKVAAVLSTPFVNVDTTAVLHPKHKLLFNPSSIGAVLISDSLLSMHCMVGVTSKMESRGKSIKPSTEVVNGGTLLKN